MKRIDIEKRAILVALVGSHGYGLARPDSDYDYRGIFIADKYHYLGNKNIEQKDGGWDEEGLLDYLTNTKDTVLYELKKFISLASATNPNIIELLWMPSYFLLTDVGKELIANRDLFLTKKIKYSFSGYAFSQIKRIETHRKWLLNPPTHKPTPEEYNLTSHEVLTKDKVNAFLEYLYVLVRGKIEYLAESEELHKLLLADIDFKAILKESNLPEEAIEYTQKLTNSSEEFISLLQKTQAYRSALREWGNYQQWLENRNPTRSQMEKIVGFDVKHGSHCIRLLRMCREILTTGEVIVDRRIAGDAEFLKSILRGEVSYKVLTELADALFTDINNVYDSSSLPKNPDLDKINNLCVHLVEMQAW